MKRNETIALQIRFKVTLEFFSPVWLLLLEDPAEAWQVHGNHSGHELYAFLSCLLQPMFAECLRAGHGRAEDFKNFTDRAG